MVPLGPVDRSMARVSANLKPHFSSFAASFTMYLDLRVLTGIACSQINNKIKTKKSLSVGDNFTK